MLIEIKDLPEGKRIEHINIDITFENGVPVVNSKVVEKTEGVITPPKSELPVKTGSETLIAGPGPIVLETRPNVEIPDEMKDLTF
jgi:hypothetical protein